MPFVCDATLLIRQGRLLAPRRPGCIGDRRAVVLSNDTRRPAQGSCLRRPRRKGRPKLGQLCARPAVAVHRRQPLYPTGRELLQYLGNSRRKQCLKDASPAPAPGPTLNNLWEPRLPRIKAFILLVSPISPTLLPLEILVMQRADDSSTRWW